MKAISYLLKKKGETLEFLSPKDESKYNLFKKNVPENFLVEVYMDIQTDDGSLAQLAKIHANIRELAIHTGHTFEDMKLIIKKRAGLCVVKEVDGVKYLYCKSLGDCSKVELSLVIETLQEVSVLLEYPLVS